MIQTAACCNVSKLCIYEVVPTMKHISYNIIYIYMCVCVFNVLKLVLCHTFFPHLPGEGC